MARKVQRSPAAVCRPALVTHAEAPQQGFWSGGRTWMGGVVDAGAGPVAFTVEFASTEDRWLVPGQEILVWVDPAWPQHVEIEWPAIPSIRDRVAAGEPCPVDPVTAIRRVAVATGTAPPDFANTPAEQRRQALRQQLRNSPPPAGLLRAQVFVVSKRPKNGTDRTGGTV